MGTIEAAGEMVTGALLGHAVEPSAGGAHGEGAICLNCGTGLVGGHCHRCGQAAHVHRSIGAIGHEILHGVVHFEGKLWRTLPLLAWRPGELTRRYILGERARFVSPMSLFLFSIFTMFAVFSIAGISPPADLSPAEGNNSTTREIQVTQQLRDTAKTELDKPGTSGIRADVLRDMVKDYDAELEKLKKKPQIHTKTPVFDKEFNTGWARLDHGLEKASKNPSLALYKLQSNSYKFSWLLIPLSLPFVWLLFAWKRQYHLYDHMVFVTYSISFMSLLFIVITILSALGVSSGWLGFAACTIPVWHMYRQIRGAYASRRWTAVLRTFVLLIFVSIVLTLFLTALIALGLLG